MTARPHDRRLPSPGAIVLALAVPLLFLHTRYLPGVTVRGAHANLSDLAVLAVVAAAVAAALRDGVERLRTGTGVWIASGVLFGVIAFSTVYGKLSDEHYVFGRHALTAAKFAEYALLAPAAVLLIRSRWDVDVLVGAIVAWSTAMTVVGLLQFLGVVNEFEGRRPLQREPSFVGIHDFAALSSAALAVAVAAIALGPVQGRRKAMAWAGGISGALGLALSGAITGLAGLTVGVIAAAFVQWRRRGFSATRVAALALLVVSVGVSVVGLRSADLSHFLGFLGIERSNTPSAGVSSGEQRLVLAYIGARLFLDHPVIGVGWQGSAYEENFSAYLPSARARFPTVPALAFPSPAHRWGVQNAFIQAAADMGLVGLAALLGLLVTGLVSSSRAALRGRSWFAILPLLWLLSAMAIWNGLGIVAGIPLDALTWLALGLGTVTLE